MMALTVGITFAFAGGAVAATGTEPADPPETSTEAVSLGTPSLAVSDETPPDTGLDDTGPDDTGPDGSASIDSSTAPAPPPPPTNPPTSSSATTSTTAAEPSTTDSSTSVPDGSSTTAPDGSTTTTPEPSTTVAEPVFVTYRGSVGTTSGIPVAGAWVQVIGVDRTPVTAFTDATGAFTVEAPLGPAALRIESMGTTQLPFALSVGPIAITVEPGTTEEATPATGGAVFTIPDPVRLDATVLDGAQAGAPPLVGATVGLANRVPPVSAPFELTPGLVVTAESYPWTAQTGADGTASLALLPGPDPVSVFAVVPGPNGVPNLVSVALPDVLTNRSIVLTIGVPVPPIQYTGTVRTADGRPIPNVWVHLSGVVGFSTAASTDAVGRFAFDLPAGPFTMSLISAGTPRFPYSFTVDGVELDLASDTDHELVVPDPVTISVAVGSSAGRPWADAYAGLDDFEAPRSIAFEVLPGVTVSAASYPWAAAADPDGVARLRLLPSAGPLRVYAARVSDAGVPSSAAIGGIDGSDDRDVEIILD